MIDEEIRKLENQRSNIISQINDCRKKIRKNKKPDEVQSAEERKRKLIDSKKKLQLDVDSLNRDKKEAMKLVSGADV